MSAPALRSALLAAVFAAIATAAHAVPPLMQPLLDEGWTVLGEDPTTRAYYRIEPQRTREGYRRAWMIVDLDNHSVRLVREFDCRRERMRNRGATFFASPGLQGEQHELRGWDSWMGFLSYDTPRFASDYNGMLSDVVCRPPPAPPPAPRAPPSSPPATPGPPAS